MKRTTTSVLLSLIVAVSTFAQTPRAEALPTVDQVLSNYVKAIGGKDAIMKINSRVIKGTFEFAAMGVNAPVEISAKAPGKSLFRLEIPGYGLIREGSNGVTAWGETPDTGLRDKSGAELADSRRDNDFYRDIRLKELYAKVEVKGKEKVGARDAWVLAASRPEGIPDTFYFDTETGLLLRNDIERENPQGKATIQGFSDDYREVDGVKLPFTLRQVTPQGEFVIKITEVKHNVPIDDAQFNKPAAK